MSVAISWAKKVQLAKCDILVSFPKSSHKCTKSVNHLIQCEKCKTWYCSSCGNVPIPVMEIISDYTQLHWFCNTCETQIGHSAYDQLAVKGVSQDSITKQPSEVQVQVQKLIDRLVFNFITILKNSKLMNLEILPL